MREEVTPSGPVDWLISGIAGGQDGVISTEQLTRLGLTKDDIRRRVLKGWLHPLHRGVYAVGHRNLTSRGFLRAALLTCGPTGFLDGRTAAADYGLRAQNFKAIEVTVVASKTPKRSGLIIHRTRHEPHRSEVRTRYGLRVATVPRLLITLAPRETPTELMRLITEAVRRKALNIASMEEAFTRHERAPGIGLLKDVYSRYRPGPDRKSNLERSFDAYAATDSRIPPYEKNVRLGPYEFDCFWRHEQFALELDGRPYHSALEDMDNDRAKDIWLQRNRIGGMRITDFRWEYERDGAVEDLLALLALARERAA
jgi:Transcriptional regulator, AbiEi antitoxin